MDADHVTAWSKGSATDIANCQMLCKTQIAQKGIGNITYLHIFKNVKVDISSQKEGEWSPPSETSRRIVAVREVFVRNQWLYRGKVG
jgi:hypothetical protein